MGSRDGSRWGDTVSRPGRALSQLCSRGDEARGLRSGGREFSDEGRRSGAEGENREIPGGDADRDYSPMDTNPEY